MSVESIRHQEVTELACPACGESLGNAVRLSYTPTTMDKLPVFDELDIVCCDHCGFGRIEKDVDELVLARYYDSDYSGKAKKRAETSTINIRTRNTVDARAVSQILFIQHHMPLLECSTVVEIGAGTGGFLFALRQMGYSKKYIAVEPQEQAHSVLSSLGAAVEKEVFTADKSEQMAGVADLVVMSHSLEHFNPGNIQSIVSGIARMLKPGGLFFCEVPNADLRRYPDAGERVVPHLSFFSTDALSRFLSNAGMRLLDITTCGASQLEKHHREEIERLEADGSFEFVMDESHGVLRNTRYHEYLEHERNRQAKRQRAIRILSSILGRGRLLKLIDLSRRVRQVDVHALIGKEVFVYGEDREFIRSLSRKSNDD